jgi:hypothetical protein
MRRCLAARGGAASPFTRVGKNGSKTNLLCDRKIHALRGLRIRANRLARLDAVSTAVCSKFESAAGVA